MTSHETNGLDGRSPISASVGACPASERHTPLSSANIASGLSDSGTGTNSTRSGRATILVPCRDVVLHGFPRSAGCMSLQLIRVLCGQRGRIRSHRQNCDERLERDAREPSPSGSTRTRTRQRSQGSPTPAPLRVEPKKLRGPRRVRVGPARISWEPTVSLRHEVGHPRVQRAALSPSQRMTSLCRSQWVSCNGQVAT